MDVQPSRIFVLFYKCPLSRLDFCTEGAGTEGSDSAEKTGKRREHSLETSLHILTGSCTWGYTYARAHTRTHTCTHTHTVQGDLASPLTFIASSCWFCHLDRNQNVVVLILSGALVLHTLNYLLLTSIQNTIPFSSLPSLTVPSLLCLEIFFRPIILFSSLSHLFNISQRNSPPGFMASSIYSNFLL